MTSPETFSIESARSGRTSTVSVMRGQYVCSVSVDGVDVLSKIKGLPWTVSDDAEPWAICDAAQALCQT